MADTSSYSIEERLVASVWVHERQHTGQTMSQVITAFREWFNKAPPRRATLLDWEKRASEVRIFWVYGDFSATLYFFDCVGFYILQIVMSVVSKE